MEEMLAALPVSNYSQDDDSFSDEMIIYWSAGLDVGVNKSVEEEPKFTPAVPVRTRKTKIKQAQIKLGKH